MLGTEPEVSWSGLINMEALACAPWRRPPASLRLSCIVDRRITWPVMAISERRGNRMLVFGAGYVGRYVSEQLKREGWHVSGTCRDAIKKSELEQLGLEAFICDINSSELGTLSTLHDATHILISIPPIAVIGDPLLCLHKDLQSLLACGNLQWLGYLSSTSVYGDYGGGWVDEEYPVKSKTESAKLRLAAEEGWMCLGRKLGVLVHVFRLGGIYGPGRSALDTIIKNKSLSKKQKMREWRTYTSRIHVADVYQSIKASFNVPNSGRIYNVVDDDPASRAEVFTFARGLIKKKWPRLIMMDSSEGADIYSLKKDDFSGEKRVSNALIKNELGVKLEYPTYREGLVSIIGSMDVPFSHYMRL